jgi:hypothetical protein
MIDIPFAVTGFLGTMLIGGCATPSFLAFLRRQIPVPAISDDPAVHEEWKKLIKHPDESGKWIGHLERMIFFFALFIDAKDAAAAIGVWLAFKVAAKWEAWNHMAYVPDRVKDVPPLRLASARRIWAAHGYATFVMGTGANFFFGAAGAVWGHYGRIWLQW